LSFYIPHTDDDVRDMLKVIGAASIDELFSVIPEALRFSGALDIENGISEFDVLDRLETMASKNVNAVCFAGGGAYDHDIPAAVARLAFRSEFVTAYTPYQPEVSQGVLQALFEFQTFVSRLFGLPIANASLYDGATALVEAVNIAAAEKNNSRILISDGVNPNWRKVAATYARGTGHTFDSLSLSEGVTEFDASGDAAAVVVQYPNYFGNVEDLVSARALADSTNSLLIVVADVVSLGLLRSPGEFGADVVIAEGQSFGTPLSFGGPYVGMMAVKEDLVRRIPGRLVGATVDADNRRAYVTTLRTREQDIRREKAASNICTNQTLIAVVSTIFASMLGTDGYRELATRCADATHYLVSELEERTSLVRMSNAAFVRECAMRTPMPGIELIDRVLEHGFLAGVAIDGGVLVAATEKRTKEEIDSFVDAVAKAEAL
jgi:glycine dehydrogenase subunit 1